RKPVPRAGGPLAGGAWAAAAGIAAIRAAEPRKVSASSTKAPVTPTKLRIVPPTTPPAAAITDQVTVPTVDAVTSSRGSTSRGTRAERVGSNTVETVKWRNARA